jgi:hypothetical protein
MQSVFLIRTLCRGPELLESRGRDVTEGSTPRPAAQGMLSKCVFNDRKTEPDSGCQAQPSYHGISWSDQIRPLTNEKAKSLDAWTHISLIYLPKVYGTWARSWCSARHGSWRKLDFLCTVMATEVHDLQVGDQDTFSLACGEWGGI